jgi:hypothetical protein
MKKKIFIYPLLGFALSLSAFQYFNADAQKPKCESLSDTEKFAVTNPEFYYGVGTRFLKTVTRQELRQAKAIPDLFTSDEISGIHAFRNVKIQHLTEGAKQTALGDDGQFSADQLNLFKQADYFTDFSLESDAKKTVSLYGETVPYDFVYYITIVPEAQAKYLKGNVALLDYLKTNSQAETANTNKYKLQAGKIRFTVNVQGNVEKVTLESTSGYAEVDAKMLMLIKNLPGTWEAATNAKGEKMNQELIFSFGTMGC